MGEKPRNIRLPQGYTPDSRQTGSAVPGGQGQPLTPLDTLADWQPGQAAPPRPQPQAPLEELYAALQPSKEPQPGPEQVEFFGQPQEGRPAYPARAHNTPAGAARSAPAPKSGVPRPAPPRRAPYQGTTPPPTQVFEVNLPRGEQNPGSSTARGVHDPAPEWYSTYEANEDVQQEDGFFDGPRGPQGPDQGLPYDGPEPQPPRRGKKKKKHRWRRRLLGALATFTVCIAGLLWMYCKLATRYDFLWLDLETIPYRDATVLYAPADDDGWQEYARLEATQQKIWVPLEEIPLDLQHAFVAIEDKNFYKHNGVSWTRTIFAVMNEVKYTLTGTYFGGESGMKQGASTITQQLVKNLTYDDNSTGVKGYFRKLREIYRAYKLDADYSKDAILQAYLNVIGFTGNTVGVQAESIKLFGVPVNQLRLEQCASIAAITKNPYRYDPARNPDTHMARRNYILYEMYDQKYITKEQYDAACAAPLGLSPGTVDVPKTPVTSYFTDKVIEDVSAALADAYHLTREETTRLLYNGGLRIYTTVDVRLQQEMERALQYGGLFPQRGLGVSTRHPVYDENGKKVLDEAGNPVYEDVTEYPQAAMVSLGYDGALKAVVGGLGEKEVSRGLNRGTDAVRQVGSTMKPIGAYALAVENNKVNWSTPLLDAPVRNIKDEATGEKREWPANFSKTYSQQDILVADALAQSINTMAVRVGERAGIGNIYRFQSQVGITSFVPKDKAAGPMVLGSSTYGVTPYQLAGAYMMFGNGGVFNTPHSYTAVNSGTGRTLVQPTLQTRQVLSADTAYVMNRMLRGVMQAYGTAYGYSVRGGMDSIGKTGTTSDNRDYWFVGLTPYYVTATWYGYDSGFALNTSQGTQAPTGAWKTVMERAQQGLPVLEFPVDSTVRQETYCKESGGLAGAGCSRTATGYYRAAHVPGPCRLHAA